MSQPAIARVGDFRGSESEVRQERVEPAGKLGARQYAADRVGFGKTGREEVLSGRLPRCRASAVGEIVEADAPFHQPGEAVVTCAAGPIEHQAKREGSLR